MAISISLKGMYLNVDKIENFHQNIYKQYNIWTN